MRFKQSPDVAWNYLGEDIIAFNLKGEKEFHQLNASAATLFQALEKSRNEAELTAILLAEFDVDATTAQFDVRDCLRELQNKRLISAEPI